MNALRRTVWCLWLRWYLRIYAVECQRTGYNNRSNNSSDTGNHHYQTIIIDELLTTMAMKPQRTPAVPIASLPGQLPPTLVPESFSSETITATAFSLLDTFSNHPFTPYAIWRDFQALSDSYRTTFSSHEIISRFQSWSKTKIVSPFSQDQESTGSKYRSSLNESSWYDVDFLFQTQDKDSGLTGLCAGIVSVCMDDQGEYKIWMLRTWLDSYRGLGHPDVLAPARKAEEWTNGYQNDNSGRDCVETPDDPYDVIIVGGGQAGLCMAGRCKALGLKYLILEKFGHVGDVWSTRYSSLTWHTPKEYGELPFGRMFPEEDPVLIPT